MEQVFTVGDITNHGRITGFHIEAGIMVAEFGNNNRHCDLKLLSKAHQNKSLLYE